MKKLIPLLLVLLALPVALTSCDDDDYYYSGYDQYLVGQWELIYADGRPVTGYSVNYLDFYSNGTGIYYFYDRGLPYNMDISWATDIWGGSSVLYINYADGTSVSMDYWYNSNATRLYTSWYSGGYRHEYVYQLVNDFTWPAPARPQAEEAERFTTLAPGK